MRVAVVPFKFPIFSETFVLNIIGGLLDRGHDVDVVPLFRSDKEANVIHPLVKKYDLLKRTIYPPCISVGSREFYLPWALRALPFEGRKPYDIVHFQFGEAALKCLPIRRSRSFGGKWVVSFRGYDISSYVKKNGNDVYKDLFREGDLFLSNSEFFRQRLISLGSPNEKAVVYRSGVDCARFTFSPKSLRSGECVRVITVGRLVEKKGVEYSLKAVARLIKEKFDIKYEVIGDGPLRNSLEKLAEDLGIRGQVEFKGAQNQEFVIERLNQSHIFLTSGVTAKDGDQNGPDNTVKEAMAMGLPVVASRSGAIEEAVEDGRTGFVAEERDVEGIAVKLRELILNPQKWPSMTKSARKFVDENYNLEKLNDELVARYQKLLN